MKEHIESTVNTLKDMSWYVDGKQTVFLLGPKEKQALKNAIVLLQQFQLQDQRIQALIQNVKQTPTQ